MASLKAIRKRIGTIRNTQQITKAMKMVSAAKLRRSQEALLRARPYAEKMAALLKNLSARVNREAHPLLREREENRVDLLLVTADRGLCGGYNANLIRAAEEFFMRPGTERKVQLSVVGRKGVDHFRRRREITERYTDVGTLPLDELAALIAERMIARFRAGEADGLYIVYSRFHSALSQVPTVRRLLPIATAGEAGETEPMEYLYEPDVGTLLASLLPRIVEVEIYHALLEAAASEHGARMTAMDSATTNAGDMIARLTLDMNRARQASITTELMEVVSTAEALR
jgi:F-type H+-transporting ATPase subunit gamma